MVSNKKLAIVPGDVVKVYDDKKNESFIFLATSFMPRSNMSTDVNYIRPVVGAISIPNNHYPDNMNKFSFDINGYLYNVYYSSEFSSRRNEIDLMVSYITTEYDVDGNPKLIYNGPDYFISDHCENIGSVGFDKLSEFYRDIVDICRMHDYISHFKNDTDTSKPRISKVFKSTLNNVDSYYIIMRSSYGVLKKINNRYVLDHSSDTRESLNSSKEAVEIVYCIYIDDVGMTSSEIIPVSAFTNSSDEHHFEFVGYVKPDIFHKLFTIYHSLGDIYIPTISNILVHN